MYILHLESAALLKIAFQIRHEMDKRNLTALVLLDFSGAFNAVNYDIMIPALRFLNISPSLINLFHSYLYGRRYLFSLD